MVTLTASGSRVRKYIRKDTQGNKWIEDESIRNYGPNRLRCIGNQVYFFTRTEGKLYWIGQDFKEKEVLLDIEKESDARLLTFGDVLCVYFPDTKEIIRFNDKQKLAPLKIPEKIGKVHSLSSSGVLMISGSDGFALFNQNFE